MNSNHQKIRELFLAAVELPEDQRDDWLNAECGDPEIREGVRRLLKHHFTSTLIQSKNKTSNTPSAQATQSEFETQIESKLKGRLAFRGKWSWREISRALFAPHRRWILLSLLGLIVTALASWFLDRSVKNSVKQSVAANMSSLLIEQKLAIETWLDAEFRYSRTWTRNHEMVTAISRLVEGSQRGVKTKTELQESSRPIRELAMELATAPEAPTFAVWSRENRLIVDSDSDSPVLGSLATSFGASLLNEVFKGDSVLWLPTNDGYITSGYAIPESFEKPGIALLLPVFSENNQEPIAAMMIGGLGMQDRFDELFLSTRTGATHETYAVDSKGFMITDSRFREELIQFGLIDSQSPRSELHRVRVANPGQRLQLKKQTTPSERAEWPLTKAAAAVTQRESGVNANGYLDYRGVPVVGAWTWVEQYGFGVITEIDYQESFEPLQPIQLFFRLVMGLIGAGLTIAVGRSWWNLRRSKSLGIDNQVGPNRIERKIGEGGLSEVFLANNQLLNRSTAIKILKPNLISAGNIERFLREIRLTSRLRHPNTISVYDYGVLSDGRIFYSMEYIEGRNLQQLIEQEGPQSPTRVAHILLEACRSLREAHALGMVHRDSKLQNIMIFDQAEERDRIKVLDFGLAKERDVSGPLSTDTKVLVGTPMYIPPERLADPKCMDPRSDLYALGIVGRILLTGIEPVLEDWSVEAMFQSLQETPALPSTLANQEIPKALDELVRDCQMRDVNDRPQSVQAMIDRLLKSELPQRWCSELLSGSR